MQDWSRPALSQVGLRLTILTVETPFKKPINRVSKKEIRGIKRNHFKQVYDKIL